MERLKLVSKFQALNRLKKHDETVAFSLNGVLSDISSYRYFLNKEVA